MAAFKRSAVIFACVFAVHFFSEWQVLCSKGLERVSAAGLRHANFVDHPFHYLNVSRILKRFVHGIDECLFACLRNVSCFSFNVAANPADGIGLFLCELLASDKYNASDQFAPHSTFDHYSIHAPCAESPCLSGGSCIALYHDNDFKCKCRPPFSGKNCGKADNSSCEGLAAQGHKQDRTYLVSPHGSEEFQVFRDMTSDKKGWTLVARFSNNDAKNWMKDSGEYWYDQRSAVGQTTNPAHDADTISPAFWSVKGTEFKITRSDDSSHKALLQTTSNCLSGQTFRSKLTSYGDFRNGKVWASDQCLGSCDVQYGGQYNSTEGFQQAQCDGNIQTRNKVGFWCDWSGGDGAVLMIGGGGSSCDRADHGVGVTEANAASFDCRGCERDFGFDADYAPSSSNRNRTAAVGAQGDNSSRLRQKRASMDKKASNSWARRMFSTITHRFKKYILPTF